MISQLVLTIIILTNYNFIFSADKQPSSQQLRQRKKNCGICFESQTLNSFIKLSCNHSYCKTCLQQIVDISLKEKQINALKCPNPECNQAFQEIDIKSIEKKAVEKYHQIEFENDLIQQEGYKHCPTPNCDYAFINDKKVKRTFNCPICNQSYCPECLTLHEGLTCKEYEQKQLSHNLNNLMIKQNTKRCPQCKQFIEKTGGCDHIHCKICNYDFCWKCLGPNHRMNYNNRCSNQHLYEPVNSIEQQQSYPMNQQLIRTINRLSPQNRDDLICCSCIAACIICWFTCCKEKISQDAFQSECNSEIANVTHWEKNLILLQQFPLEEFYKTISTKLLKSSPYLDWKQLHIKNLAEKTFISPSDKCTILLSKLLSVEGLKKYLPIPGPEDQTMDDNYQCNFLDELEQNEISKFEKIEEFFKKNIFCCECVNYRKHIHNFNLLLINHWRNLISCKQKQKID